MILSSICSIQLHNKIQMKTLRNFVGIAQGSNLKGLIGFIVRY